MLRRAVPAMLRRAVPAMLRRVLAVFGAAVLAAHVAPSLAAVPGEGLRVSVGLAGKVRYGQPRPVTIDVLAGSDGVERAVVLVQGNVRHVIPATAPPGGRRRIHAEVAPWTHDEAWLDGTGRALVPEGNELVGHELTVELTSDAASVLAGAPYNEPAALRPGDAPRRAVGWRAASVVFVDAADAARLESDQWRALEDHVLEGGALVLHGSELDAVPRSLLAREPVAPGSLPSPDTSGAVPVAWLRPPSGRHVEGDVAAGVPPLERPGLVARRRHGLGQLVLVGFDLGAAAEAGLVENEAIATFASQARSRLGDMSGALSLESLVARRGGRRELVVSLGLAAALLLLLVMHAVVERRSRASSSASERSRRLPILAASLVVGLTVFALGALVPTAETDSGRREIVLEEYFPEAGRLRITRHVQLPRSSPRLELPPGDGVIIGSSAFAVDPHEVALAGGEIRWGAQPLATDLQARAFTTLWWRSVTWEDVDEPPLRLSSAASHATLEGAAASWPGLGTRLSASAGGGVQQTVLRPDRPKIDPRVPEWLREPGEWHLVRRLTAVPDEALVAADLGRSGGTGVGRVVVVHRPRASEDR